MNGVIYARFSAGPNQTYKSIEGQLRDCHAFAEREGLTVVGEYIDRAISGKSDDRPDFQRMIADARPAREEPRGACHQQGKAEALRRARALRHGAHPGRP